MEWYKVMRAGKQKNIVWGYQIELSQLLKVEDDIYSHLLSQHVKDRVARC